jgi:hypothetical protein
MLRSALVLALSFAALSAQAQAPNYHVPAPHGVEHYDARYNHNYYYPTHGAYVHALPGSPVVITRGGGRYYYSGGVWFAPSGPRFVVVSAPIGVFVPVLPAYYTTVWVGGVPYYYANDTYYAWGGTQNGYQVVAPPNEPPPASQGLPSEQPPMSQGLPSGQPPMSQAAPSDDLFIYPQSGQSAEQQATDKFQCHQWAVGQTGFDPTQSAGAASPEQYDVNREGYQRAMRACLEGRGYSVR